MLETSFREERLSNFHGTRDATNNPLAYTDPSGFVTVKCTPATETTPVTCVVDYTDEVASDQSQAAAQAAEAAARAQAEAERAGRQAGGEAAAAAQSQAEAQRAYEQAQQGFGQGQASAAAGQPPPGYGQPTLAPTQPSGPNPAVPVSPSSGSPSPSAGPVVVLQGEAGAGLLVGLPLVPSVGISGGLLIDWDTGDISGFFTFQYGLATPNAGGGVEAGAYKSKADFEAANVVQYSGPFNTQATVGYHSGAIVGASAGFGGSASPLNVGTFRTITWIFP